MMDIGGFLESFQGGVFYAYTLPVVAVAVSFFFLVFTAKYLTTRLKRAAAKTENTFDDMIADILDGTNRFFLLAVSLYIGSQFLEPGRNKEFWETIIGAFLIFQTVRLLEKVAQYYTERLYKSWGITVTQANVAVFFLRIILWFFAAMVVLENLGIRVTPLLAGLGIGGIAIALAVQNVLGELIASLSIIVDKPFVVGDFIVVGGFRGEVEKIGFKTTRIRSVSGELVVFSNNQLVSNTIQNYKNLPRRRSFSTLGVVYETDAGKLKRIPEIIKDIIDRHPKTEYERVHFVDFADFSLNFEVAYYVLTSEYIEYLDTRQQINLEIIEKFRAANIEFAYPTQTLFAGNAVDVRVKN